MSSLRRHIMMQQAGGIKWLIGYRFASDTGTSIDIVPDETHAVLLNLPVEEQSNINVYGGASYDYSCRFKCQIEKGVAFDYWSLSNDFHLVNTGTSYISICVLISEIENVIVAYLPTNPTLAYSIIGKEVSLGNYIYRYYSHILSKSVNNTCIFVPNQSATKITMLLKSAIFYYSSSLSYIDYWSTSYPNTRTLNVGTNVAYFISDYNENESAHLYIKDANTQGVIWDNGL